VSANGGGGLARKKLSLMSHAPYNNKRETDLFVSCCEKRSLRALLASSRIRGWVVEDKSPRAGGGGALI
jgi:hypothetical protein